MADFQLRKCAKSEQTHEEDRISLLPTEILLYILSFLKLKEVARASLVSKRWMGFWMFAVQLDFDASKVLKQLSALDDNNVLREKRRWYVEWVNKVLQSHKAMVIDEFRICFELDKSSQDDIDKWLRYAFSRRVQTLELNFLMHGHPEFLIFKPYLFPSCRILDQSCEKSSAESPSADLDNGICTLPLTDFKSLKSLTLAGVDITEKTLNFLINNFHCLERLTVSGSHSRDLTSVAVCRSSLKYLELTYCHYLKSIIVRDTCLASLKISWVCDLVLENVPMLVNVWVSRWMIRQVIPLLSSLLSRLEVLTLLLFNLENKEERGFHEVPQLTGLKQLILTVGAYKDDSLIRITSSFVQASPNLEKFVLELHWHGVRRTERKIEKVSSPPLQRLKVVEILGYFGRKADDELVMYFLENGTALERIILDPRSPEIMYRKRIKKPKAEKMARIHAGALFKELMIPSFVELVIL
ncbi:OLC1v1011809C1 [Oldenlandia corymbosa var. corymbosa]|uniref:OLC1v1011809C1 n=1 Tax=Oldenlandia corymbosa var. corymbosa TaxID=529605 RepID=A0AAV1DXU0_OLDCO|nr:OLC1v1011809C1 [Oldenlandia corymbosa var. corymbosa]